MYTNGAIIILAVACSSTLRIGSARSLPRRDVLGNANETDMYENSGNANSTLYSNNSSCENAAGDQRFMNGTQRSTTLTSVEDTIDYSAHSPPPDSLSLPLFIGMPSSFPSSDSKRHCAHRKGDDGMSIALPLDLYTGAKSKCGQKVVVTFESAAGKPWSGNRNNLTLKVVDAFERKNQSDASWTVLLNDKAWRAATGNSIINPFESWPIRWFFLDPEVQNDTVRGIQGIPTDADMLAPADSIEYDSFSKDNSTDQKDSGNATDSDVSRALSVNKPRESGDQSNLTSNSQNQQGPASRKNVVPVPGPSYAKPNNKRNLVSRRSSKPPITETSLFH